MENLSDWLKKKKKKNYFAVVRGGWTRNQEAQWACTLFVLGVGADRPRKGEWGQASRSPRKKETILRWKKKNPTTFGFPPIRVLRALHMPYMAHVRVHAYTHTQRGGERERARTRARAESQSHSMQRCRGATGGRFPFCMIRLNETLGMCLEKPKYIPCWASEA